MRTAILFLALALNANADIKSTTGQISIDVQNDSQPEVIINDTGVGIATSPSSNLHVQGNTILSNQVYIGSATGSSNLNVNGLLGFGIQTITSDTTLGSQSIALVDTSSDNVTLTLPPANTSLGQVYRIKRITDNEHFAHLSASDNIDGTSDYYDLLPYETLLMVSNGTQWYNLTPDSSTKAIPASDNLVAWYKFNNDNATSIMDSSPNERTGTLVDGANVTDNYLDLDGNNDEVVITGYKGVIGTASRSVSLWMRGDQNPLDKALVSWGTNSPGEKFIFRCQETNGTPSTLRVEVNGGYAVGSTNILDSAWHHVVMTLEDDGSPNVNEVDLYVDGVQETLSSSSNEPINTTTTLDVTIGNDHSDREFDGNIDDVRIFDKALSAEEIAEIYSQGR